MPTLANIVNFGHFRYFLTALSRLRTPFASQNLYYYRGSGYIKSDGDIDVFVDYPPKYLVKKLQTVLTPQPYLSGPAWKVATETHWKNKGCPTVHMVFNDWAADEMVRKICAFIFQEELGIVRK